MLLRDLIIHMDRLGKGTMETLPFHSRKQFTFSVIENFNLENEKISSTLIQNLHINKGEMEQLSHFLGRFYTYKW